MMRRSHIDLPLAGFTLLEMLVVVTILALVAAIAMPFLPGPSNRLRLQTAAHGLTSALRLTRATAITRSTELTLVIDVDRRTFESPVVPLRSFDRDISVQMTIAEPERSTPYRGGFRFFADGSSTGGDLTLRLQGNEERICVNWLTGEARQERDC